VHHYQHFQYYHPTTGSATANSLTSGFAEQATMNQRIRQPQGQQREGAHLPLPHALHRNNPNKRNKALSPSTCYGLTEKREEGVPDTDLEVTVAVNDHQQPPSSASSSSILSLSLRGAMVLSRLSQRALQDWDEDNGLPRSHSITMIRTNRSRRQLEEGRVLRKWNGRPLIGTEEEEDRAADHPGGTTTTFTPCDNKRRK
jgi:hypothetical protein